MKPKIIQVMGVAFEKAYTSIDDEIRNDFGRNFYVKEELDFNAAYKTNRRGCHYDIFLGPSGTIVFRPFHFVDGLDNFCSFNLKLYSTNDRHAMEFYQWSSKRESSIDLWLNGQSLMKASQKKTIRVSGDRGLMKDNDVYKTTDFFLKYIVGVTMEELSSEHKIFRCEIGK